VSTYQPRPRPINHNEAELLLLGDQSGVDSSTILDQAIDLAGSISDDQVPHLIDRARSVPDRWLALTLLAAGTHLPQGPGADAVLEEIQRSLNELRSSAEARPSTSPFPAGSPWLVDSADSWTPFFARLVAPTVRATVANQLFDGGYADGVVCPQSERWGDLDDWATGALALTPLFDPSQLAMFEKFAATSRGDRSIFGGTLRAFVYAGIAVGYGHRGNHQSAYRVLEQLFGPEPDELRQHVLAEIL
jgi:hypothetical protein